MAATHEKVYQQMNDQDGEDQDGKPMSEQARATSRGPLVVAVLLATCAFPAFLFTTHSSTLTFSAGNADAGSLLQWACESPSAIVSYILACLILCVRVFATDFAYGKGEDVIACYRRIGRLTGLAMEGSFGLDMDVKVVISEKIGYANALTIASFISIGLCCLLGTALGKWTGHLQGLTSFTTAKPDSMEPMPKLIPNPEYFCNAFGFVSMPVTYFLAKLVLGSFIQDIVFGTKNLHQTKDKPLGFTSAAFVAYQFLCMTFMYTRLALLIYIGEMSGTPLQIYGGALFYLAQQSATASMILLASKMFVELNVDPGGTAPWYFGLVEKNRTYKIPGFSTPKERVFRSAVISLAPILLLSLFTHYIFVILLVLGVGLLFPLWGTCLLVLWALLAALQALPDFINVIELLIITGASMHMQVWSYLSFALTTMLVSCHLREKLWIWEGYLKGERPHGNFGYLTQVSTVVFAFPATLSMQCLTIWAVLAYDGYDLGNVIMVDINMREFSIFNACLVAKAAPVAGRVLSWAGLFL